MMKKIGLVRMIFAVAVVPLSMVAMEEEKYDTTQIDTVRNDIIHALLDGESIECCAKKYNEFLAHVDIDLWNMGCQNIGENVRLALQNKLKENSRASSCDDIAKLVSQSEALSSLIRYISHDFWYKHCLGNQDRELYDAFSGPEFTFDSKDSRSNKKKKSLLHVPFLGWFLRKNESQQRVIVATGAVIAGISAASAAANATSAIVNVLGKGADWYKKRKKKKTDKEEASQVEVNPFSVFNEDQISPIVPALLPPPPPVYYPQMPPNYFPQSPIAPYPDFQYPYPPQYQTPQDANNNAHQ